VPGVGNMCAETSIKKHFQGQLGAFFRGGCMEGVIFKGVFFLIKLANLEMVKCLKWSAQMETFPDDMKGSDQ
jgi:hypothetical protein